MPAAIGSAQPSPEPAAQAPVPLGANLNVTPKRLVLGRGQRTATVYIFNQGNAPATFDISMVDRIMKPDGEIVPIGEANTNPSLAPVVDRLKSAQGMIIAVPRRAVLAPGKGQTIRIMLTGPAAADSAEHRTHLTVLTVPPRSAGLTAEEAASAEQSDQMKFQVTTVFGVSIPVIVRSGPADARGQISNAHVKQGVVRSTDGRDIPTAFVAFDLERLGTSSLFGNVEVRASGEKSPVAIARGLGVYPEIDKRSVELPLKRALRSGERLDIVFIDDDATPGRLIARAATVAP